MKTLEITLDRAKQLYPNADKDFKTELEDTFGKDAFIVKKAPEPAPAYEILSGGYLAACEYKKMDPALPYPQPANNHQKRINQAHKIIIFGEAVNELDKFEPDYSNDYQTKMEPRFIKSKSGFVFSRSYFVCWVTRANVGPRLSNFRNTKVSDWVGKTIENEYSEYLILMNS